MPFSIQQRKSGEGGIYGFLLPMAFPSQMTRIVYKPLKTTLLEEEF